MSEDLSVELGSEGGVAVITLRGFVNMETSEVLAEQLSRFAVREGATRFLFDARELEYVSSAGVWVFIDLYDRYEDRGSRIAFVGLRDPVRRVLHLVGYLGFFGDFAEKDQALAHLKR